MKRAIAIFATAVCAAFLCAQSASAFPGERMPYRAIHFAGKVVNKIDRHVIHPVVHGVDRHLR